ncbi:MAG TPA: UDP-glucose 4-epimerase GalE [Candidatus Anoxymicrobiaceae bacterium]
MTGGAGYIGSVMVGMLLDADCDVLVVDNLSRGHQEAVPDVAMARIDLENLADLRASCLEFQPEVCMHFAGSSLVEESVRDPLKYLHGNLVGGLNLLRSLADSGCDRLIFSSSCSIFGIPESVPITEETPAQPINPYGLSKLLFENVLSEYAARDGVRFVSLRYFNAAGAFIERGLGEDHEPETHLIPRVIGAALGKEPQVIIYGTDYPTPDGTCIRDYVHVVDLCQAHLLAMEHLTQGGESRFFNLGTEKGYSVREVVDSVARVSGKEFPVVETERRPGDPPILVSSSRKIVLELGWKPRFIDLDQVVKTAYAWHSSHPEGYLPG